MSNHFYDKKYNQMLHFCLIKKNGRCKFVFLKTIHSTRHSTGHHQSKITYFHCMLFLKLLTQTAFSKFQTSLNIQNLNLKS